ncbi:hypothetical protein NHQ30_000600 [Ciborinia camelliae]|nr:hypothetical protein NHQ30_000600 [Ciborinia camelliae]
MVAGVLILNTASEPTREQKPSSQESSERRSACRLLEGHQSRRQRKWNAGLEPAYLPNGLNNKILERDPLKRLFTPRKKTVRLSTNLSIGEGPLFVQSLGVLSAHEAVVPASYLNVDAPQTQQQVLRQTPRMPRISLVVNQLAAFRSPGHTRADPGSPATPDAGASALLGRGDFTNPHAPHTATIQAPVVPTKALVEYREEQARKQSLRHAPCGTKNIAASKVETPGQNMGPGINANAWRRQSFCGHACAGPEGFTPITMVRPGPMNPIKTTRRHL